MHISLYTRLACIGGVEPRNYCINIMKNSILNAKNGKFYIKFLLFQ